MFRVEPFKSLVLIFCIMFSALGNTVPNEQSMTKVIKSGCEVDYPPFCFIDENGLATGFSVELLRAVCQIMERDVEFHIGTWHEVKGLLESGEIDALPLVGRTPERENKFDFTFPYLSQRGVIVTRKRDSKIKNTQDLKGKNVAVMKGDNAEEFVRRQNYDCNIHTTETFAEALLELSDGNYDAVIIQRLLALQLIHQENIKNLKIAGSLTDEFVQNFCLATENGDKATLSLLNEGLALIINDGTFQELQSKWFGPLEQGSFPALLILKIVAIFFILTLFILMVISLWLRSLRKEVAIQTLTLRNEISERSRVEVNLRSREEQLQLITDSLPFLIGYVDTELHYHFNNSTYSKWFGLNKEDIYGKHMSEILGEPAFEVFQPYIKKVMKGETVAFELNVSYKSAGNRFINSTYVPHFDDHGQVKGFFSLVADITVRKEAEREQQAKKLEALGILAGGIAHDFNNLFGGIYGYIEMAIEVCHNRSGREYLAAATSTIDRARGITAQLITFAKGGAPSRTSGNLHPFILETVKFALSGSNIKLNYQVDPHISSCSFDKVQMSQVIENLTINSSQAMLMGGTLNVNVELISLDNNEVAKLKKGDYIRISFKDTGTGIREDILPNIFDPFYSTMEMGRGLGLSTSRSIVERHDGHISVHSEYGKGTLISIYLPALPVPAAPEKKQTKPTHPGKGMILLMDDEEVVRDTVSAMVKKCGYYCVAVQNGQEAIEEFKKAEKEHKYQAVILDLTIPGGWGGIETIKEIRKLDEDIPVFISSGYADDPTISNPQDFGFTDSIKKPFMKTELCELLKQHL